MNDNKGLPIDEKSSSVEKEPVSRLTPDLPRTEVKRGARKGSAYVRIKNRLFQRVGPGHFVSTTAAEEPHTAFERLLRAIKRIFIGRPLHSSEESHERLNVLKGLATFGSDAISSSAYATEASLLILMAAGNAALRYGLYTSIAVAAVFAVVVFSYRQVVYAYPQGGGSYNVSRENLGKIPGLVAASALLIDYVLTVAVSIVAGVQAILSALIVAGYEAWLETMTAGLPAYLNPTVILSLVVIGLLVLANLRGTRESGRIFAVPTLLFIVSLSAMILLGVYKYFMGTLEPAGPVVSLPVTQTLTLWLILRAFSAGAVAMTGTEAVSNGVSAFEPPESKNAARTLLLMALFLGSFFLGVSFLATHLGIVPGQETIISQTGLAVFGEGILYYTLQVATMGILVIAANPAFAGFPRLSSILAHDGFMPHQFQDRGDRLVYSTGITALALSAAFLVVAFQAKVGALINIYAIGVFLAFTLSNAGMTMHWLKKRTTGWRKGFIINGLGAVLTGTILIIASITQFSAGGWIVIVLSPAIVLFLMAIRRHYTRVEEQLRIEPEQLPTQKVEQLVLLPLEDLNYASLRAITFARTICNEIAAIHISIDPDKANKLKEDIQKYAPDLKLIIIESPKRFMTQPLLSYVNAVHQQSPTAFVTIVLPEFIPAHLWERLLHNRTARKLINVFETHPNITVVLVPYLLKR